MTTKAELFKAMKKPSKYRAVKTVVDGVTFHSKKEAKRYQDLRLLEKCSAITQLELQPRYELIVNNVKIGRYTGDFRYLTNDGLVVEDCKGYKKASRDYILRKKLMKALHGIEILET